ncbi:hypothetical protein I3843_13G157100 [Carya illinoinensis]|nr:hypothetical protein I3843_13G157100 [Carya illinoinensis]
MGHMLWKSIKGGWGVLYQHIGFMVDDGSKIRFWHDIWCVDTTLKDSFLVVYEQKASVAELLGVSEGSMQCNVSSPQAAQDWEICVFFDFFNLLYSSEVRDVGSDKMFWVPSKKGIQPLNLLNHTIYLFLIV